MRTASRCRRFSNTFLIASATSCAGGMRACIAGSRVTATPRVRVDMRGSGESDGIMHDEYLALEQDDALEVIDWIARQPWCSGEVGMMGKSWGAYNSLQVAARRPPALKAIIAVMGTDDRFAECIHYSGGCLLNDNFWWGCIMQMFNARPPDPAIVGERWRADVARKARGRTLLAARSGWSIRRWTTTGSTARYASTMTRSPARRGSGAAGRICIAIPRFGWREHLQVPHKVTMGPWAHLYPHEGAPAPAVGFPAGGAAVVGPLAEGQGPRAHEGSAVALLYDGGRSPEPQLCGAAGTLDRGGAVAEPEREPRGALAINADGLRGARPAERALTLDSPQSTGLAAAIGAASAFRATCRAINGSIPSARWNSTAEPLDAAPGNSGQRAGRARSRRRSAARLRRGPVDRRGTRWPRHLRCARFLEFDASRQPRSARRLSCRASATGSMSQLTGTAYALPAGPPRPARPVERLLADPLALAATGGR